MPQAHPREVQATTRPALPRQLPGMPRDPQAGQRRTVLQEQAGQEPCVQVEADCPEKQASKQPTAEGLEVAGASAEQCAS